MSSHFSPKSLLFYGTMIGSVVILFRIVSVYGETNLKAPTNVAGQYVSEQPLPGCPDSTRLALTIEQSGVYLHGAVDVVEASKASTPHSALASTKKDLTLGGFLDRQQISLNGSALLPANCQIPGATAPSKTTSKGTQFPMVLEGTVSKAETAAFTGRLSLGSLNLPTFVAIKEKASPSSDKSH